MCETVIIFLIESQIEKCKDFTDLCKTPGLKRSNLRVYSKQTMSCDTSVDKASGHRLDNLGQVSGMDMEKGTHGSPIDWTWRDLLPRKKSQRSTAESVPKVYLRLPC